MLIDCLSWYVFWQVHAKLLLQGEAGYDGTNETVAPGGEEAGGGSGASGTAVAMELLAFPQINVVDFGSIHINERSARKVGPLSWDLLCRYSWCAVLLLVA